MQPKVGAILEGKITGITKFGAFVELAQNLTGMVHISEIAPTYVKEITDFVSPGQMVKVKVLSAADGKISLSMKKAVETAPTKSKESQKRGGGPELFERVSKKGEAASFEDMLSKFKQSSDEKMSALKKGLESKRGGVSRHGSGQSR